MNYKVIFETERLVIRQLKAFDKVTFFDMMGNPNVMNPIPQKVFTNEESDEKFQQNTMFHPVICECHRAFTIKFP